MAYDERLADRISRNLKEKKMFSGICFMVNENYLKIITFEKTNLKNNVSIKRGPRGRHDFKVKK